MGKYQLDSKAQANIGKFHEKHSNLGGKGSNTQSVREQKIEALKNKMKKKNRKRG